MILLCFAEISPDKLRDKDVGGDMPRVTTNPWRKTGLAGVAPNEVPSVDAQGVSDLLSKCPKHRETPLLNVPDLAQALGITQLMVKDERQRMGLGSFKALGAAYAIAREAQAARPEAMSGALSGQTFVTASAGNHGLSVAVGAQVFGARAVIYLSETVPEAFAARLRDLGAVVRRAGAQYEASMAAAEEAAETHGWRLLSDSTWPGYTDLPMRVMEGYLQLAAEAAGQMKTPPTHILLQAGVGGLACAVAAYARKVWEDVPQILVVEPEAAPALREGILAGRVVDTAGPVSSMGRLDCKTASLVALNGLARDADAFVTLSEEEVAAAMPVLERHGLATTPSGGAGLAALVAGLELEPEARVWAILSEGPEDA